MTQSLDSTKRLTRPLDVGEMVAARRKEMRMTQDDFAKKLGVSRKTVSDLERGVAENISLSTALKALALADLVIEASRHRKPNIHEVLATRAREMSRNDANATLRKAGV